MNENKIDEFIWHSADITRSNFNYQLDVNYLSLMFVMLLMKKITIHDESKKDVFFTQVLSDPRNIADSLWRSFKKSQDLVPESVYAPLLDRLLTLKVEKDVLLPLVTMTYRIDFSSEELPFLAKKLLTFRASEGGMRSLEHLSSKGLNDVFEMFASTVEGGNYYDPFFGCSSFIGPQLSKKFNVVYGHEINKTIAEIANAYLFIIDKSSSSKIIVGDCLLAPLHDPSFQQKSMDLVLSSPPLNQKPGQDIIHELEKDILGRFSEGICRNDLTMNYLENIASVLKETGKAFVTTAFGSLSRAGIEEKVRKSLVTKGKIECVISLPSGLFSGTSIPSAIVCLSSKESNKKQIKFILAEKLNLKRVKGERFLSEEDLGKIWEAYNSNTDIKDFSKVVKLEEVLNNNSVLLPSRYIAQDLEINFVDFEVLEKETEQQKQSADKALFRINELLKEKQL